jgi:hypothetical protein
VEMGAPGLRLSVNGLPASILEPVASGEWELRVGLPQAETLTLAFELTGVGFTNFLAWVGRMTGMRAWQRFRAQNKNRQLRVTTIATDEGEVIFDFSDRHAPYSSAYVRRHAKLGMNIVGFLTAELGVGESARCMVRAADAAGIPTAVVPLKLNCKNRLGDHTYASRLQEDNPHGVNVTSTIITAKVFAPTNTTSAILRGSCPSSRMRGRAASITTTRSGAPAISRPRRSR